ncbi:MAG: hypothetical protein SF339_15675 [Blastocatellia bacterium]|nr:hypothetical protein [Blastocatellia bacterium]
MTTFAAGQQQPTKPKRPVKNPPQFPSIIDLEGKAPPAAQPPAQPPAEGAPAQPTQPADALTQAVMTLTSEVRTLTQELRAMNIRQQAQLDTLKMTRVDMRIDHYERELRPVRDRMALIDAEEQTLNQLLTRESLQAQLANVPTFNRDDTMRQLRLQHETRLRAVMAEKERLRKLDADLTQSLSIYQKLSTDTENRIQKAEEQLRELEEAQTNNKEVKKPQ